MQRLIPTTNAKAPNCIKETKSKLEKKYPDKKFYTFVAETIDYAQLDNFNFIEAWINTACPRIEEDIKVLNIEDLHTN